MLKIFPVHQYSHMRWFGCWAIILDSTMFSLYIYIYIYIKINNTQLWMPRFKYHLMTGLEKPQVLNYTISFFLFFYLLFWYSVYFLCIEKCFSYWIFFRFSSFPTDGHCNSYKIYIYIYIYIVSLLLFNLSVIIVKSFFCGHINDISSTLQK